MIIINHVNNLLVTSRAMPDEDDASVIDEVGFLEHRVFGVVPDAHRARVRFVRVLRRHSSIRHWNLKKCT